MDTAHCAILKADINAQRVTVDRIFKMIETRAAGLKCAAEPLIQGTLAPPGYQYEPVCWQC
jgi:hypothetical protein